METKTHTCNFCKTERSIVDFHKSKAFKKNYLNKCKDCVRKYRKEYNKNNKEEILKYNLKYNKIYNIQWGQKHKSIIKWRHLLERCLKYQGKNKNTKTQILLGYTHEQFKNHISFQFTPGMDWENISIDHKIPLTWFNKNTPAHLVNDLRNLQPLYKADNTSKLNRYADEVDFEYMTLIRDYLIPPRT